MSPPEDDDVTLSIAADRWLRLASSPRDVGALLVQFTTAVEVYVIMHWRLRSQDRANVAGASCKVDTLSVILANACG